MNKMFEKYCMNISTRYGNAAVEGI